MPDVDRLNEGDASGGAAIRENTAARTPVGRHASHRPWLVGGIASLPVLLYIWASLVPGANPVWVLPTEHFLAVTVIALLATGVALLVARVALRMDQMQILLLSLGFAAMAGFFSVHALSTPGVLMANAMLSSMGGYGVPAELGGYGIPAAPSHSAPQATADVDYASAIVGLSAFLSLFVPSLLFAGAYSPGLVAALKVRLRVPSATIAVVLTILVAFYGVASLTGSPWLAALPVSSPPGSYLLAATSVVLFLFSAWRQERIWSRTRFPIHGTLVLAFALLAEAQILMVVTPFWSATWWGYHALMLAAVILALSSLFVELDRRRGLERFLPAEVVERVVSGDALRLTGERRTVTVLFADLRNSTAMAENLPAEQVLEVLNAYVGAMADAVFTHGGMLDKYLGDGLMAIFGIVPDQTDGAEAALQAAVEIRRSIAELNLHRSSALGVGVGLHTGEVVLGSVGIPRRADFTAIGDTVNIAARMEGLCKEHGRDLVISETTASRLRGTPWHQRLEDLGDVAVRGRQQPVRIFTLPRLESAGSTAAHSAGASSA